MYYHFNNSSSQSLFLPLVNSSRMMDMSIPCILKPRNTSKLLLFAERASIVRPCFQNRITRNGFIHELTSIFRCMIVLLWRKSYVYIRLEFMVEVGGYWLYSLSDYQRTGLSLEKEINSSKYASLCPFPHSSDYQKYKP